MPYMIEVTDTFGGEANYAWVKRETLPTEKSLKRRTLVEHAKRVAGWNGWCRVNVNDYGDTIEVRPTKSSGVCQVAFVSWVDEVES